MNRTKRSDDTLVGAWITLGSAQSALRPSGALWAPEARLLVVADLHLGRSERVARRGGPLLPPYETVDALDRLEMEIAALDPARVLSLGDGFDDLAAASGLDPAIKARLRALAQGREWIWVAGNHDPEPPDAPGVFVPEATVAGVAFRHIAAEAPGAEGEASGHFHPKATIVARGRRIARRCFLASPRRLVLPAFCAFAGGLDMDHPAFDPLFPEGADAWLLGRDGLIRARRRPPAPCAAR